MTILYSARPYAEPLVPLLFTLQWQRDLVDYLTRDPSNYRFVVVVDPVSSNNSRDFIEGYCRSHQTSVSLPVQRSFFGMQRVFGATRGLRVVFMDFTQGEALKDRHVSALKNIKDRMFLLDRPSARLYPVHDVHVVVFLKHLPPPSWWILMRLHHRAIILITVDKPGSYSIVDSSNGVYEHQESQLSNIVHADLPFAFMT